ncbi:MAG: diguanylate cyclase [Nitrosomonas sp.]|nr:diguanylate cyclase [Nitrosomonas sp.]
MTNSAVEFEEKMRILVTSFAEKLPAKINEIELMWNQLQVERDTDTLEALHRQVHGLTGSGKTFGFPELSIVARELEQLLKGMVQNNSSADEQLTDQIQQRISALKIASKESRTDISQKMIQSPIADNLVTVFTNDSRLIFVVDDDEEAAEELVLQLSYYGYEVEAFNQLDTFRAAINKMPNAIVLIGVEFHEDKLAGIKVMREIQKDREHPVQVIFISAYDNLNYRLGAVRVGGSAYFTKPINSSELIDHLDSITLQQEQESYRVLIVDDSSAVLGYHAAVLEQAGMTVKKVLKPMEVMETLLEFDPDIILMDIYMPECSGIELAKVIRQLNNFVSIPIVYLSSENDFNTQLEAMSLGGDDFLVKPIDPHQLVSAVTMRVRRTRLLRSFMVRDGLTSLFNHTSIKEQLGREVVRSARLNTPLSFAMIDIDFFKKVNDTYGHSAGDRVIKSMSRLLKQRLRGTDIIGRYGGEEFAVILMDTDAPSAAKVIDEIRHVFSRLLHLSENEEFSVTFSCGIADLSHFPDEKSISEAADKALYQAKKKGRNQVVINSDSGGED